MMKIHQSDLVLEIGSGNNPNPRSDILVDRYVYDNGQRAGGFRIVVDRPLIVADGYKLPFADKSFDCVICSHILEHMEYPKKFIAEVMRVGKAGYIEVPSDISERIFGWNFHLWYCSLEKGKLILRKKTEGEKFSGFFHRLIAEQIWFRRFFEEYEKYFFVKYEWKQVVNLIVHNDVPSKSFLDVLDQKAWDVVKKAKQNILKDSIFYFLWMGRRIIKKFRKIWRKTWWKWQCIYSGQSIVRTLVDLSRCPSCRSPLVHGPTHIQCEKCKQLYPQDGVIPVLLVKNEQQKGY